MFLLLLFACMGSVVTTGNTPNIVVCGGVPWGGGKLIGGTPQHVVDGNALAPEAKPCIFLKG